MAWLGRGGGIWAAHVATCVGQGMRRAVCVYMCVCVWMWRAWSDQDRDVMWVGMQVMGPTQCRRRAHVHV